MLREMSRLKRFSPRSLLAKLKGRWRKKTSMTPTEMPPITSPTTAPPITRSAAPAPNVRVTEASAVTRCTIPVSASTESQASVTSLSRSTESQSLAALFAKPTESRYFSEDGEVLYLARPYWAPFRKVSAGPTADGRPRGQCGYIEPPRTSTGALADLIRHPMKDSAASHTQRVLNAVDSGNMSTGLGRAMIS